MKFIDLFCGIGGFRLALEKRGAECVFSSEIDPAAQKAYKANFGEAPGGDITEIPADKIPKHDILCAGFPCQSFSISGKQAGISDHRGKLFYEIVRIAKFHKPVILLLENVKNILSVDNGEVIKTIEKELKSIGYDLYINSLNSSFFGIPQSRERVYFAGLLRGSGISYAPPTETMKPVFLKDILETRVDENLIIKRDDIELIKTEDEIDCALRPLKVGLVNKGGQGERIYSPKGHAITQSAFGGGVGAKTGLYHTKQGVRRLTITECKKVMGFPEKHVVAEGNGGYRQLGNAVIPAMIELVYNQIEL